MVGNRKRLSNEPLFCQLTGTKPVIKDIFATRSPLTKDYNAQARAIRAGTEPEGPPGPEKKGSRSARDSWTGEGFLRVLGA